MNEVKEIRELVSRLLEQGVSPYDISKTLLLMADFAIDLCILDAEETA